MIEIQVNLNSIANPTLKAKVVLALDIIKASLQTIFPMDELAVSVIDYDKTSERWLQVPDIIEVSPITLHCNSKQAWYQKEEIHLTKTEFLILQTLLLNKNNVTPPEAFAFIWPDIRAYDFKVNLKTYIKRLRNKLQDSNRTLIRNRNSMGYIFVERTDVDGRNRSEGSSPPIHRSEPSPSSDLSSFPIDRPRRDIYANKGPGRSA